MFKFETEIKVDMINLYFQIGGIWNIGFNIFQKYDIKSKISQRISIHKSFT